MKNGRLPTRSLPGDVPVACQRWSLFRAGARVEHSADESAVRCAATLRSPRPGFGSGVRSDDRAGRNRPGSRRPIPRARSTRPIRGGAGPVSQQRLCPPRSRVWATSSRTTTSRPPFAASRSRPAQLMNDGLKLAAKGAVFSARVKLIGALELIADARDAQAPDAVPQPGLDGRPCRPARSRRLQPPGRGDRRRMRPRHAGRRALRLLLSKTPSRTPSPDCRRCSFTTRTPRPSSPRRWGASPRHRWPCITWAGFSPFWAKASTGRPSWRSRSPWPCSKPPFWPTRKTIARPTSWACCWFAADNSSTPARRSPIARRFAAARKSFGTWRLFISGWETNRGRPRYRPSRKKENTIRPKGRPMRGRAR